MNELKPCPFCGSKDIEIFKYIINYFAQCNNCGMTSGKSTTKKSLILYWNTRLQNK